MKRSHTPSLGNSSARPKLPTVPSDRMNLHDVANYITTGLSAFLVLLTLMMWSQMMAGLSTIKSGTENQRQQINSFKSSIPTSPAKDIALLNNQVSQLREDLKKEIKEIPDSNERLRNIEAGLTEVTKSLKQLKAHLAPEANSTDEASPKPTSSGSTTLSEPGVPATPLQNQTQVSNGKA